MVMMMMLIIIIIIIIIIDDNRTTIWLKAKTERERERVKKRGYFGDTVHDREKSTIREIIMAQE